MKKIFWDSVWAGGHSYVSKNGTKELPWETYTYDKDLEEFVNQNNIEEYDVLELGCGSGNDTLFLSKKAKNVTAIDVSEVAINIAKENNVGRDNVEFIVGDLHFDLPDKKYDLIYDRGCFHNNLDIINTYFKILHSRLKPGGKAILISGNLNNKNNRYTTPDAITISAVELPSSGLFHIKYVKEIVHELNKNYENCLGWFFVLEKVDPTPP